MARHYEFDKTSFDFKKARITVGNVLLTILKWFLITVSLAVVYYLVFSSFIRTDTERRLRRENRMYERIYSGMEEREKMISDVVTLLQTKDNDIYRDVFSSDAPGIDPFSDTGILTGADSLPDHRLVEYTYKKADKLLKTTTRVEQLFRSIFEVYPNDSLSLPPLSLPLENMTYAQFGASVGMKVNPFYKVPTKHDGLDMIAPQGDPVLAAGDGYVSDVIQSRKGLGNIVEITHAGSYVTRYCHLSDIAVKKGQRVKKGTRLGLVGISGNSFAPHLHFEVLYDGVHQDPINYFFASVTPSEYANMLYMSVNTGQSMD